MRATYIINPILVIGLMVLAAHFAGGVVLFFDIGSILIVVCLTGIMLLASFGLAEIMSFFALVFKRDSFDSGKIQTGILFFDTAKQYLMVNAVIGFIVGVIHILAKIDDISMIGPGLATSILTVFYSMVFMFVIVLPFRAGLQKMLIESAK